MELRANAHTYTHTHTHTHTHLLGATNCGVMHKHAFSHVHKQIQGATEQLKMTDSISRFEYRMEMCRLHMMNKYLPS